VTYPSDMETNKFIILKTKMKRLVQDVGSKTMTWMLVLGATMSFSSCSKEDNGMNGGMSVNAEVTFTTAGISDGNGGSLEKAALQSELATQPLGDGIELECRLQENATSTTRSSSPMASGVKYRVLVYDGSSFVDYRDYTAGSESSTSAITLETGKTYKVVAYSYNTSAALPTFDNTSDTLGVIDPSMDLLYYQTSLPSVSGSNAVSITFAHKFSRISVVADASPMGETIQSISSVLTPGYAASLNLLSGTLNKDGNVSQSVTWSDPVTESRTSELRTVFTNGESPITLTFPTITIGSKTYSGKSLSFALALEAGKSYTLTANFKRGGILLDGTTWANGNLVATENADGSWKYDFQSSTEIYSATSTGGDYWHWNVLHPGFSALSSNWNNTGSYDELLDPCTKVLPIGTWKMPTQTQMTGLRDGAYTYGYYNGVSGIYFGTNSQTEAESNKASYLFLPEAGWYLNNTSTPQSDTQYWSSTPNGISLSYFLGFKAGWGQPWVYGSGANSNAYPIRCVKK
jgi:hypothetical protein